MKLGRKSKNIIDLRRTQTNKTQGSDAESDNSYTDIRQLNSRRLGMPKKPQSSIGYASVRGLERMGNTIESRLEHRFQSDRAPSRQQRLSPEEIAKKIDEVFKKRKI